MIEWQEVFVQHNVIITYLMTSLLCQYDVILIQEVPAAETFDFFSISILRNIMEQIFFRQDANKISSFQDKCLATSQFAKYFNNKSHIGCFWNCDWTKIDKVV